MTHRVQSPHKISRRLSKTIRNTTCACCTGYLLCRCLDKILSFSAVDKDLLYLTRLGRVSSYCSKFPIGPAELITPPPPPPGLLLTNLIKPVPISASLLFNITTSQLY
jgi:hypothetical protein